MSDHCARSYHNCLLSERSVDIKSLFDVLRRRSHTIRYGEHYNSRKKKPPWQLRRYNVLYWEPTPTISMRNSVHRSGPGWLDLTWLDLTWLDLTGLSRLLLHGESKVVAKKRNLKLRETCKIPSLQLTPYRWFDSFINDPPLIFTLSLNRTFTTL